MFAKRVLFPLALWMTLWRLAAAADRYDTDISGQVLAIEGTTIVIKDAQGKRFRAESARSALDPQGKRHTYRSDCQIEVTGQELVKNLQPGVLLQLECRLANRRVIDELKKVSLVAPHNGTQSGVLIADPVADTSGDMKRKLEDCVVLGQLTKNRSGNLTVAYAGEKGNIDLSLRLQPDDLVEVIGGNLSAIRPGDKIRAKGFTHGLPHFFARDVQVEHVPFVEDKPKLVQAKKEVVAEKPRGAAPEGDGTVKLQVIKVN